MSYNECSYNNSINLESRVGSLLVISQRLLDVMLQLCGLLTFLLLVV